MLSKIIQQRHFIFADQFATWEEAIVSCCQPLILTGAVDHTYAEQIIASIRQYGPYIVIAPYVALPHCQENATGVKQTTIGFMRVKEPVIFDANDRSKDAQIFFTLASENHEIHLQNLMLLANALDNEEVISALRMSESESDLRKIAAQFSL